MSDRIENIIFAGARVEYSVTGSGPAVMLVHGFGENREIWTRQKNFLFDNYKLIIPDLPGSGRSELMKQSGPADLDIFAECLYSILDNEKISRCIMLGHSMGGYITLAMAERYPEMLQGFGLIHSTAFADSEEKINTRKKGIDFIKTHGSREFLKTSIPGLFHHPQLHQNEIDELLKDAGEFSPESLCYYSEAMMKRPDRRHIIANAKIPFLLVAGSFDQAVPLSQSLMLSYLAENTEFHVLRKSGHMGMLEETEKCNLIFSSFLANLFLH